MKKNLVYALLAITSSSGCLWAQAPPPPPPAVSPADGTVSRVSGSISQFNYNPEGRIEGFVITPNTLVMAPPDWAMQIEAIARRGDQVDVTGELTPAPTGMQVIEAASIRVGGKTLAVTAPSEPAPYAGSGTIAQLNYGRRGETNGFVLQDGAIARTPPFATTDISVIRPGARVAISGFAHVAATGRTVVEVQSITVNGQTIALNNGPRPDNGPGPDRGPRDRRGPRDAGPPPPPAPPDR